MQQSNAETQRLAAIRAGSHCVRAHTQEGVARRSPCSGRTSVPATLMKSSSCGGGPTPAYLDDTRFQIRSDRCTVHPRSAPYAAQNSTVGSVWRSPSYNSANCRLRGRCSGRRCPPEEHDQEQGDTAGGDPLVAPAAPASPAVQVVRNAAPAAPAGRRAAHQNHPQSKGSRGGIRQDRTYGTSPSSTIAAVRDASNVVLQLLRATGIPRRCDHL